MNSGTFERFDAAARQVLEAAWVEAAALDEHVVATEHVLLALATADGVTANLLAEAGAGAADVRHAVTARCGRRADRPRDQDRLLTTLGVDLAEVRRRAEQTFGTDAVARAARRTRPRRPRRPLWTWISCSRPLPSRSCDSPLAGHRLAPIPRVKRLLERATRAARPGPASSRHLLLVLLTGNEPASEVLEALGVDLDALASATRRSIDGMRP